MPRSCTELKGSLTVLGGSIYVTFLLAVPLLVGGIWLASRAATTSGCVGSLHAVLIVLGLLLMTASVLGFAATCSRHSVLIRMYLIVAFLIFATIGGVMIFAFGFAVTSDGRDGGNAVVGRAFKEYELSAFHGWLRSQVEEAAYWESVKLCLRKRGACGRITGIARDKNGNLVDGMPQIYPVEGGCCVPPSSCGFKYYSGTWGATDGGPGPNADCSKWGNEEDKLCYACAGCKAGVLAGAKKTWRRVSVVIAVVWTVLAIATVTGIVAFRRATS